jgi:hypothetical protein
MIKKTTICKPLLINVIFERLLNVLLRRVVEKNSFFVNASNLVLIVLKFLLKILQVRRSIFRDGPFLGAEALNN